MPRFWTPCPVFGQSVPNCQTPQNTEITAPIPFIFTVIVKLIISPKKMPLVCQNATY